MKKRYEWIQNIFKTMITLDLLDNLPTRYTENLVSIASYCHSLIHEVVKVRLLYIEVIEAVRPVKIS